MSEENDYIGEWKDVTYKKIRRIKTYNEDNIVSNIEYDYDFQERILDRGPSELNMKFSRRDRDIIHKYLKEHGVSIFCLCCFSNVLQKILNRQIECDGCYCCS